MIATIPGNVASYTAEVIDANEIQLVFGAAVAVNQYDVIVLG